MSVSTTKSYRDRKREQRTEERTINLIERLARALAMTKSDAERASGVLYGDQAVCVKALKEYERWDQERRSEKPP